MKEGWWAAHLRAGEQQAAATQQQDHAGCASGYPAEESGRGDSHRHELAIAIQASGHSLRELMEPR